MCIIIYKPVGKSVSDKHLDNSSNNHPHGCGFAFVNKKGRTIIYKNMDPEAFKEKLRETEKIYPDSPFIIHYRKLTHGSSVLDNCHPFRVSNEIVFAHNGTVHKHKPDTTNKDNVSDTRLFNTEILKQLPDGWFDNEAVHKMLDDYIGLSKLAILRNDKKVVLINEKDGTWEDGVWYSNTSFRYLDRTYNKKDEKKNNHYNNNNYNQIQYWDQDGVYVRYNPFVNETQAEHPVNGWCEFDLVTMKFKKYPSVTPLSTPEHLRDKSEKDNAVDMEDHKRKKDYDESDLQLQCEWCRIFFNESDLGNYQSEWGTARLCDDCANTMDLQLYGQAYAAYAKDEDGRVH